MIEESAIPRFPPGLRLREDKARGGWVLLAPERVFLPDEHALAVLRLVDGERSIGAMIDRLAALYEAGRAVIAADVMELLQDLLDKGSIQL